MGEDPCIEAIRLGELSTRLGEIAHLPRVDHADFDPLVGKRFNDDALVPSCRLQDDSRSRTQRLRPALQRGLRSLDPIYRTADSDRHIDRRLADVNSDPSSWRMPRDHPLSSPG